jgi:hypothetical protein
LKSGLYKESDELRDKLKRRGYTLTEKSSIWNDAKGNSGETSLASRASAPHGLTGRVRLVVR